jgi:hypothetical protein
LKILRFALLSVVLGCGGRGGTIWGGDESGFAPAGSVRIEPVGSGLKRPVYVTAPRGDARLFVVEQAGVIRVVKDGVVLPQPFLDIQSIVHSDAEQGLLSMAFHPAYQTNGYFFVYFLDRAKHVRIERFRVSGNPDVADPESRRTILSIHKPGWEHNGGLVKFGPDGMLYIGTGDGGNLPRLWRNAQDTRSLLGKMLRIDVNNEAGYRIPAGNAFPPGGSARPEIWAVGLRNPWRYAFDRQDGLLYIADVGQGLWEEVHVVPANRGAVNYGWSVMEGNHCYAATSCNRSGLDVPALEYGHGEGCSVTGGFVYRGAAIPGIRGLYFYSDYCAGFLKSFRYANGAATEQRTWNVGSLGAVLSFGEDAAGELYILSGNGTVYRMASAP